MSRSNAVICMVLGLLGSSERYKDYPVYLLSTDCICFRSLPIISLLIIILICSLPIAPVIVKQHCGLVNILMSAKNWNNFKISIYTKIEFTMLDIICNMCN
uniref:Uncharacterized protein n=1 Tax=Pyxicephalus adspersus TaxID=30357 RepID=A0AAV3A7Q4_PYXAD|nr:TPA: hypothetical protein GDO54_016019 [Pyxicephalus adspersus]